MEKRASEGPVCVRKSELGGGVTPLFQFGRETRPVCCVSSGVKISKGKPLENAEIPETVQPRMSAPAAPPREWSLARPKGSCQVPFTTRRCDVEIRIAALGPQ